MLRKAEPTLWRKFATNEEKILSKKILGFKFSQCGNVFYSDAKRNKQRNRCLFSGDFTKENIAKVSSNDITSITSRIEIAWKDPVACDLFLTNNLEILFKRIIGFDTNSKLPREKWGLFGIPGEFGRRIESQVKGTLENEENIALYRTASSSTINSRYTSQWLFRCFEALKLIAQSRAFNARQK